MLISLIMAIALSFGPWHHQDKLTWYGPGYYGNRTACGQKYTKDIIGIASNTMKCGTLVQVKWYKRTVIAKVIDWSPVPVELSAGAMKALGCKCKTPYTTRFNVKWRKVYR